MKRALLLALVLCGCASMPRYETRPVAFSAAPATPFEQARAICAPRADLVANQARLQARAQKQTEQYTSPYSVTGAGEAAYKEAGTAAFSSCLAEYGWRVERRCVENCR